MFWIHKACRGRNLIEQLCANASYLHTLKTQVEYVPLCRRRVPGCVARSISHRLVLLVKGFRTFEQPAALA
eukprot:5445701-Pleurochrysis_carterae.AAC.2